MSSEEVFRQLQELRYWQESQQRNSLNTDFQNLQFTQQSQQSQTKTNEVPKTPTSPPKPKSRGKRKSKKTKDPKPSPEEGEHNVHTKWTSNEEKLFAECWIAASEDARVGRFQARDTFWQRVQREFNRKNSKERNKDMLQSKWKKLIRD